MNTLSASTRRLLLATAAVALLAACVDEAPLAPDREIAPVSDVAMLRGSDVNAAIATLRRVTARYHRLEAAIDDGFVLLHPCENRPGEGPVGAVYVHMDRLLDGKIDARSPDALVYQPARNRDVGPKLVAVEFALPYAMWTEPDPPRFLDATFQREDEFGVFALHVWVWRHNPEGLFAETNPRVSCGED